MISVTITRPNGENSVYRFALSEGVQCRIGRDTACEISLPEEDYLSRVHCLILYSNGQLIIQDNQSSNGIFLKDQRIVSDFLIMNEPYRMGNCYMTVQEDDDAVDEQEEDGAFEPVYAGDYGQPVVYPSPTQAYPVQPQPYPPSGASPQPQAYPQPDSYPAQPQPYPPLGASPQPQAYPQPGSYPAQPQPYPPSGASPQPQAYPQPESYPAQPQPYPPSGASPQPQAYPQVGAYPMQQGGAYPQPLTYPFSQGYPQTYPPTAAYPSSEVYPGQQAYRQPSAYPKAYAQQAPYPQQAQPPFYPQPMAYPMPGQQVYPPQAEAYPMPGQQAYPQAVTYPAPEQQAYPQPETYPVPEQQAYPQPETYPAPEQQVYPQPESYPAPEQQAYPQPESYPAPEQQVYPQPETYPAPEQQVYPQPESYPAPEQQAYPQGETFPAQETYTGPASNGHEETGAEVPGAEIEEVLTSDLPSKKKKNSLREKLSGMIATGKIKWHDWSSGRRRSNKRASDDGAESGRSSGEEEAHDQAGEEELSLEGPSFQPEPQEELEAPQIKDGADAVKLGAAAVRRVTVQKKRGKNAHKPELQVQGLPGTLVGLPTDFELHLSVTTPSPRFEGGAPLRFCVKADRDCRIFLIAHDSEGGAELILPGDEETDNLVFSAVEVKFPGMGHEKYHMVVEPPFGIETIVLLAVATTDKCDFAKELREKVKLHTPDQRPGDLEREALLAFREKHGKHSNIGDLAWTSAMLNITTLPQPTEGESTV